MITSPASISSWTAWMVSSCFSRCCVEPRSSMARARWTGSTVQVIWNYEAVICCNTGVSWWQWHVNKHHKTSTKTREIIENSAQPSQVHHSQSFEALAQLAAPEAPTTSPPFTGRGFKSISKSGNGQALSSRFSDGAGPEPLKDQASRFGTSEMQTKHVCANLILAKSCQIHFNFHLNWRWKLKNI